MTGTAAVPLTTQRAELRDMQAEAPGRPVLHFIDTTGPGGGETVFLQLASAMNQRGWESHMVVVGPGWVLDKARTLDIPVEIIETRGRVDIRYVKRLASLVRSRGIKLIHAHFFSPAVYASATGILTGVPVVATFHGAPDSERGGPLRWLRYALVNHRSRIVAVSEALRQDLLTIPTLRTAGIDVVHNGVDTDAFARGDGSVVRKEHRIGDTSILVGAIGNVRPAKDYHTFLRSARQLAADPRYTFAIVGERTEPLYGELLQLRAQLGLDDRVAFWGFREDIPAVVSALDALVISSSNEGFSLATIQAMAAGTPVVATRSGGPEEIITEGADGFLVPAGDPAAIAGAVSRLVSNPSLRSRITGNAAETVAMKFSLAAMVGRYESIYRQLTR